MSRPWSAKTNQRTSRSGSRRMATRFMQDVTVKTKAASTWPWSSSCSCRLGAAFSTSLREASMLFSRASSGHTRIVALPA